MPHTDHRPEERTMPYTDQPSEYASPRLFRDLTSFPRNEMGEPLMDATAWRFEQALDAESADDPDRYYDAMDDDSDDSDDPDYCDYHDAIHRTDTQKRICANNIAADALG